MRAMANSIFGPRRVNPAERQAGEITGMRSFDFARVPVRFQGRQ